MNKKLLSIIIVFGLIFTSYTKAQSLDASLSGLADVAAKPYLKTVINSFGSNLNSGWVSQFPSTTKLDFHLDLKITATGSFFSDDKKTFSQSGNVILSNSLIDLVLQGAGLQPGTQNYNSYKTALQNNPVNVNFSGPTIVGSKDDHVKLLLPSQAIGNTGYIIPQTTVNTEAKGLMGNLPAVPTATAQLTVGTVFGTNVAVRYLPEINIQDMGKLTFWGVGIIHNIGVWFPNPLPVDISVGYFYQKLKLGSILETDASQIGAYVSKSVSILTVYGGITTETSSTSVNYTYQTNSTANGSTITFKMDAENTAGAVVGFNLNLAIININADYKFAKTSTASAGISFGF